MINLPEVANRNLLLLPHLELQAVPNEMLERAGGEGFKL